MKIRNKILSYLLILIISLNVFNGRIINVKANNENDGFYTSTITINGNSYPCYEYYNSSLLPDTYQIYWVVNGKVQHALWSDSLLVTINKRYGLALENNWFLSLYSYLNSVLFAAGEVAESFFTNGVYRVSNGTAVVGIAIGDISGLKLSDDNNADLTIPSNIVNNTWNIVNNYIEYNPIRPAYINFPTVTYNMALSNIDITLNYGSAAKNALEIYKDSDISTFNYSTYSTVTGHYTISGDANYECFLYPDYDYIVCSETQRFDTICTNLNLTESNYSPSFNSLLTWSSAQTNMNFEVKLINNDSIVGNYERLNTTTTNISSSQYSISSIPFYNNSPRYGKMFPYSNKGYLTVYRTATIVSQIQNNTYQNNYYKSTTYNDYDVNNDNSITITYNQRNNSTETNNNIYNESKTTTNNNITENNYQIDNSVNDNSVTTIINNYYGDSSGGGGDDDHDDDTIWKALLKAIAGFFEKIGELIATLLTGIFSIFTSILDAITSITEDFTSITSFISSFFSWLPTPITSLIVLGLGLALICAFLTWFKK